MDDNSLIEKMKGRIDPQDVHDKMRMTQYEQAVYFCRPSVFSMIGMYVLAFVVLGVHLAFWWVNAFDVHLREDVPTWAAVIAGMVDFLGITGFTLVMLLITWVNRFQNGSTSGRWYTSALLLITVMPSLFMLDNFLVLIVDALNILGATSSEWGGILPDFSDVFYLVLGVLFSGGLFALTVLYQGSFSYAISDRTVYLKKDFIRMWHSEHNIPLLDIDNLKVTRSPVGRILNFGTVNMVTGSGYGIKSETVGVSAGAAADAAAAVTEVGFLRKIIRMVVFVITLQRTRETMNDEEPSDCLYGVRRPMEVYRLINELKERIRVQSTNSGSLAQPAGTEVAEEEAVVEQTEAAAEVSDEEVDELLDGLEDL